MVGMHATPLWAQQTSGNPAPLLTSAAAILAQPPAPTAADTPHTIGVGVRAGGYTFGLGASVRVWTAVRSASRGGFAVHFDTLGFDGGSSTTRFSGLVPTTTSYGERRSF